MKILALDVGDVWIGSALSDALGIVAKPYETVTIGHLIPFLKQTIAQQQIKTIIIGYPKTMKGTESLQTKKVVELKQELEEQFPTVQWVLWDERLSSKRASTVAHARTKDEKIKSHSIAAAFILESYLTYLQHQKESQNDWNE